MRRIGFLAVCAITVLTSALSISPTSAGERLILRPATTVRHGHEKITVAGRPVMIRLSERDGLGDQSNEPSMAWSLPGYDLTPLNGIEDGPDPTTLACYDNRRDCVTRMEWACGSDGPGGDHGGWAEISFGGGSCAATCADGTSVSCTEDN